MLKFNYHLEMFFINQNALSTVFSSFNADHIFFINDYVENKETFPVHNVSVCIKSIDYCQ